MDTLGICAVVLHFRAADQTLECVRSLQAEGVRYLVLVDNSEDAGVSLAGMRAQLEALGAAGLRNEIVAPPQNVGFARGVNLGLARALAAGASGVLLVNSDAWLEPGALVALTRALRDAAVAVPVTRSRRGESTSSLFGFYQRAFALVLRKPLFRSMAYPSGCCLLLRADVVKPNLFDEDFFFYGEDVVLGCELQVRKARVAECPAAVIAHAGSGSAKNGSMFYEYHINRGHWLLARKLASNSFQHVEFVVCRCVSLPLRAMARSLRFRSLTPWRGFLKATMDVVRGRCRSFTPPVV